MPPGRFARSVTPVVTATVTVAGPTDTLFDARNEPGTALIGGSWSVEPPCAGSELWIGSLSGLLA